MLSSDAMPSTPAMLGLCGEYGWKVLHRRWDDIFSKVLALENVIYESSAQTYTIMAVLQEMSEPYGWEHLKVLLTNRMDLLTPASEIETALRSAYRQYWIVVTDQQYWQNGHFGKPNGWIPYDQMSAVWLRANGARMEGMRGGYARWMTNK